MKLSLFGQGRERLCCELVAAWSSWGCSEALLPHMEAPFHLSLCLAHVDHGIAVLQTLDLATSW